MPKIPQSSFAKSFNSIAATYTVVRPSYPNSLFEAIEKITGKSFNGAEVRDVGAGTGIATRLMEQRGARIIAVEPGERMATQFRADNPDIRLVRADGNALPFSSNSATLITYAQAWHWTLPEKSVPEAMRVLQEGGSLAMWWNVPDVSKTWVAAQHARLSECMPDYHAFNVTRSAAAKIESLNLPWRVSSEQVYWAREISIDLHLANLASLSYFAVLDPEISASILANERIELLEIFPDGLIEEPYRVDLTVAVKV